MLSPGLVDVQMTVTCDLSSSAVCKAGEFEGVTDAPVFSACCDVRRGGVRRLSLNADCGICCLLCALSTKPPGPPQRAYAISDGVRLRTTSVQAKIIPGLDFTVWSLRPHPRLGLPRVP